MTPALFVLPGMGAVLRHPGLDVQDPGQRYTDESSLLLVVLEIAKQLQQEVGLRPLPAHHRGHWIGEGYRRRLHSVDGTEADIRQCSVVGSEQSYACSCRLVVS